MRQIAGGQARSDELAYWDDQLTDLGTYIVTARQQALLLLDGMARDINGQLTAGRERLRLVYRCSIDLSGDIAATFRDTLVQKRRRDIQAGMSLCGPHRDDLSFLVDGVDMRVYGSRGQQRTVALSLKFAEARYMCGVVGEEPILLLDDIMSELDVAPARLGAGHHRGRRAGDGHGHRDRSLHAAVSRARRCPAGAGRRNRGGSTEP